MGEGRTVTGAPRALALTPKAWQALAHTARPVKGTCPHCRQLAYVWAGKVACVTRSGPNRNGHLCPGSGKPPRRAAT